MDTYNSEQVDAQEKPVYVSVEFSTTALDSALDEMNEYAQDGYALVETIQHTEVRTSARDRNKSSIVVIGYFIMELQPIIEVELEAVNERVWDRSLFEEDTGSDQAAVERHVFVKDAEPNEPKSTRKSSKKNVEPAEPADMPLDE